MKPPLGPIPWLPPRGWCGCNPPRDHVTEPCPHVRPIGDGHTFLLPDATLDQVRAFHRDVMGAQP